MKALVITPESVEVVEKDWEAKNAIHDALGGWLEALPMGPNAHAFIDEDGKFKELPYNDLATKLCFALQIGLRPDDCIVGTMIVFGTKGSDEADVPEEVVQLAMSLQ